MQCMNVSTNIMFTGERAQLYSKLTTGWNDNFYSWYGELSL